ncbi:ATP-binding cassette domain-containing protein [Streptococcus suis]
MKLVKYLNTRYLVCTLFFSILTGLDTLVMPIFVSSIIDSIENKDIYSLFLASLYGIIGYSLLKISFFFWQISYHKLMLHFNINIKKQVMAKAFFNSEKSEFVQNILYRDIDIIQKDFIQSFLDIIYCLWFALISAVYIFIVSWEISSIFICFSIIPIIIPKFFSKAIKRKSTSASAKNQLFLQETNEELRAISVIRHYLRTPYFLDRFLFRLKETQQANYDLSLLQNVSNLCIGLVGGLAGLTPFIFGGWLTIQGKVTVGGLVAVFLASDRVLSPLQSAFSLWTNVLAAIPLKEKLESILCNNKIETISQGNNFSIDSIKFDSTEIGHTFCLYTIHAKVFKNEKILLIGSSGSGKSTLFTTLFQEISPLSNKILINNQDLMSYSQSMLFATIGYIPQELIIFEDSLAFNITLGENFTDEEIESVLRKVGLAQLLDIEGLSYNVGENGCRLSGGEKARIVIARALIRNYSLLLVDEFSASLDKETATKIRDLLLNLDITLIEIAHHFDNKDRLRYHQVWRIEKNKVEIFEAKK